MCRPTDNAQKLRSEKHVAQNAKIKWRRTGRQAICFRSGAFVDRFCRLFRCFSEVPKSTKTIQAVTTQLFRFWFPIRELKISRTCGKCFIRGVTRKLRSLKYVVKMWLPQPRLKFPNFQPRSTPRSALADQLPWGDPNPIFRVSLPSKILQFRRPKW